MTILIILFGILVLLAGVLLLINPDMIFGFLQNNIESPVIHVAAVLVRLVIGVLLIAQSGLSRFPLAMETLGWVFIIAAIVLAVMGRGRFRQLLSWVLTSFKAFGRIAGVIAVGFGSFITYAFI